MNLELVLAVLGALIVSAVGAVLINRVRLRRANAGLVDELFEGTSPSDRVFTRDDLNGLPDPVKAYLDTVLEEGQPYVRRVRMKQRGDFRLGDATSPWKPLKATQHVATESPGFVWEATIKVLPFVSVNVVDMYKDGEGSLRAKLLSIIEVADEGPSPELNAGELMRYLGESVWFPTALLPNNGVKWEAIDEHSAEATLDHRDTTASLRFHFNDQHEVVRVSGVRPYLTENGAYESTRWTGYWGNYREKNGMRIPTEGEVEWNRPDGDLPYWRATLEEIEHE